MPHYAGGVFDVMWPWEESRTSAGAESCEYCTRVLRPGATSCEGCGAPRLVRRATVSSRVSRSMDSSRLEGVRVDDETGRAISDREWADHEYVDVTTFGSATPRYLRTRRRA